MPNVTDRRHYANFAPQRQLASGITSGALSLTISSSFAGWPVTFPFYAVINYGQSDAEIIRIDDIVGTTATIGERGSDSSSAQSHSAGATLDACFIRKDIDEANAHSSATSAVHGVAGNVVGDDDVQTLTNKTIADPTLTGTATAADIDASGDVTIGGTLTVTGAATTGAVTASGTVDAPRFTGLPPQSWLSEATDSLATPAVGTSNTGAKVTITLSEQRRVRIKAQVQVNVTVAGSSLTAQAGYEAGATFSGAGATGVGKPGKVSITGGTGSWTTTSEGTALLAAGEYTFGIILVNASGGVTYDNVYLAVYDVGPA